MAWKRWIKTLVDSKSISVPRGIITSHVAKMVLHGFADASKSAVAACIYLVAYYDNEKASQHLLVAKARIAPEKSIPRLELIAALTLSKLMAYVKHALEQYPISEVHGWVDSTTVLHWMKGKGTWSLFVRNRIKAITDGDINKWHYVPTGENPSDLGSRGCDPSKLSAFWFCGPNWLSKTEDWPKQPEISEDASTETERLPKKERQMLAKEEKIGEKGALSNLLEKHPLWKTLRITALVMRFISNCRDGRKKNSALSTEEIESAEAYWIRKVQQEEELMSETELVKDPKGIWRCSGRVAGYNPILVPRNSKFAELLIEQSHKGMLHGGVSATMCKVRERFWMKKLRSLVKKVIHNCNHCKRFRVKALPAPTKSLLPDFRAQLTDPFIHTGVDFAGPILYRESKNDPK